MTDATKTIQAREPIAFDWISLGAALVTVVLWASAFVGIRAVAGDLSPGALAVGRLLVGSRLVLSEVPPVLALLDGALCIGGVIVARSRGRLWWRRPVGVA